MNKLLLGGIAASAIIGAGIGVAQAASPAGQPAPRAHKAMQTETRAEVQNAVARHFAKLDSNKDGIVTKAEIDALQAQRSAKMQQRAEQRAQRFDPAKFFGKLDSNKDGKITKAEAEAAQNARALAKGGQPAKAHAVAFGGLFERADANKDGAITRAEFDSLANQMHARMEKAGMARGGLEGRMFQMADSNKDGKVSLGEAQQSALQHFDRADVNHDGKLTPDERKQLRSQRKPS